MTRTFTADYNHADKFANHVSPQRCGDEWVHFVST